MNVEDDDFYGATCKACRQMNLGDLQLFENPKDPNELMCGECLSDIHLGILRAGLASLPR